MGLRAESLVVESGMFLLAELGRVLPVLLDHIVAEVPQLYELLVVEPQRAVGEVVGAALLVIPAAEVVHVGRCKERLLCLLSLEVLVGLLAALVGPVAVVVAAVVAILSPLFVLVLVLLLVVVSSRVGPGTHLTGDPPRVPQGRQLRAVQEDRLLHPEGRVLLQTIVQKT